MDENVIDFGVVTNAGMVTFMTWAEMLTPWLNLLLILATIGLTALRLLIAIKNWKA